MSSEDNSDRNSRNSTPNQDVPIASDNVGIRNALYQTIQLIQQNVNGDNYGQFHGYDLDELPQGARDALLSLLRYNEEDDEDYVPDFEMDEDDDHDMISYNFDEEEDVDVDDVDRDDEYDDEEEEEEEEEDDDLITSRIIVSSGFEHRRIRTPAEIASSNSELEQVPNKKMTELLGKGEFGSFLSRSKEFSSMHPQSTSRLLLQRKLGMGQPKFSEFSKRFLPNDPGRLVKKYYEPAYGGQFSHDGSLFYSYTQDFKVHVYDVVDPTRPKLLRSLETASGHDLPITSRWTITDADISRNNRLLIHSTRSPVLSLSINVDATDSNAKVETIPLITSGEDIYNGFRTVVFSTRFSADASIVITGNSQPVVNVFDMNRQIGESLYDNHTADINSVKFVDDSNDLIISGSDDATIRLWDRRVGKHCVGVFPGHIEGITCVESKGDGRYILSNGKDQSMKLWDLRKILEPSKWSQLKTKYIGTGYKYQFEYYRSSKLPRHPNDLSVMTFRGHEVVRTAIRCHFSPSYSTDQQYVYSGSSDGNVYIWKLDGTLVRKLEGSSVSKHHSYYYDLYNMNSNELVNNNYRITCIRDCSWHPSQPFLYAPAWSEPNNIEGGSGSLLIFSYNHENDKNKEGEFEYLRSKIDDRLVDINRVHSGSDGVRERRQSRERRPVRYSLYHPWGVHGGGTWGAAGPRGGGGGVGGTGGGAWGFGGGAARR